VEAEQWLRGSGTGISAWYLNSGCMVVERDPWVVLEQFVCRNGTRSVLATGAVSVW
jgi:hypothetical protein